MKPNRLFALLALFFCSIPVWAQSPIEGTWEIERTSTTSPDGKKTEVDKTSIKALLVITPTHFVEVARTIQGDSSALRYADYGSYSMKGNKIKLTPLVTSRPEIKNLKFDVTYTIKGPQVTFTTVLQDPTGKRTIAERVVRKVNLPAQLSGDVLGTWNVVSGSLIRDNESRPPFDPSKQQIVQVITPTHLATVHLGEQSFHSTGIWPIIKIGDHVQLDWENSISSMQVAASVSSQFTSKLEAGKLRINWTNLRANGTVIKRDELMERVEGQKALANK